MAEIDEPTPVVSQNGRELEPDRLYAVLTYRGDLAAWNWAFYIPDSSVQPIGSAGTLFHIINVSGASDGWKFETRAKDIVSSHLVVAIVRLGDLGFLGTYEEVVGQGSLVPMLKSVPLPSQESDIRPSEFSTRVWFLEAICALHECGVVTCDDVWLLEREIRRFAFMAMDRYLQNQGWTVFISEQCS